MKENLFLETFLKQIKLIYVDQPEFVQAVFEVFTSIAHFLHKNPQYYDSRQGLLQRMVEPERVIQFRVCWVDDQGNAQVNRAWRIQFNSASGPFKGGMRFHPSVNLSILKFLGFEQTFKNALTNLPIGGGKGGADFNPKGKSYLEIMRFCQALITELYRHLGNYTDIPAGDIGVGEREIGFMTGMMKKLSNNASCVFTGKGLSFGGSVIRAEATGYGLIYFTNAMLKHHGLKFEGKRVSVSGSGNVAQYAIEKSILLGAKVVTVSDSTGAVIDETGFTIEKLERLKAIKNQYGCIKTYAKEFNLTFLEGKNPWFIPVDIALPCATQNELNLNDAKILIKNGVKAVVEGANMPTTIKAKDAFIKAGVLFGPGKAANAGGVAISGLEMIQNATYLNWELEKINTKLKHIMLDIHEHCVEYGSEKSYVNYIKGANIASFIKVANAMLAQGIL